MSFEINNKNLGLLFSDPNYKMEITDHWSGRIVNIIDSRGNDIAEGKINDLIHVMLDGVKSGAIKLDDLKNVAKIKNIVQKIQDSKAQSSVFDAVRSSVPKWLFERQEKIESLISKTERSQAQLFASMTAKLKDAETTIVQVSELKIKNKSLDYEDRMEIKSLIKECADYLKFISEFDLDTQTRNNFLKAYTSLHKLYMSDYRLQAVQEIAKKYIPLSPDQTIEMLKELDHVTKANPNHFLKIGDQLIEVSRNKNKSGAKTLEITNLALRELASGGSGTVYDVTNLSSTDRDPAVAKIAKPKQRAMDDLQHEANLLKKIHASGTKTGIQEAPYQLFHYNEGGEKQVGYLAAKYEKDGFGLANDPSISPDLKEKFTNLLIQGLDTVHSLGIYHGDLKPDNTLFRREELVISDFGGAREFEQLVRLDQYPRIESILGVHTPLYTSKNIRDRIIKILNSNQKIYHEITEADEKQQFLIHMLNDQIKPLLLKNDRFALGCTLYSIWTGKYPGIATVEGYRQISSRNGDNCSRLLYDQANAPFKVAEIIGKLINEGLG